MKCDKTDILIARATGRVRPYIALLFVFLSSSFVASRAQVQVEARIDSMQMLIGEQVHLTLAVTMKSGQALEMPHFESMQQITAGVEVLEQTDADTIHLDGGDVRVTSVYTITSFDENLYYIPPIKVMVDGKEYKTKNLALKVLTVPVDTLHPERFFPPKDVQDNPFQWREWSTPFLLSLLIIVLICVVVYLLVRLHYNKPIITIPKIVKRLLPHQKAMSAIEVIKAERMTTSEDTKAYYTRLTDILRKYIEERFGFNAMEMTSAEIIEQLQKAGDRTMIDELRELFTTADLVKFAKHSTLINENDANLVHAIDFINSTKIDTPPVVVTPPTKEEMAAKVRRENRIAIKIFIAVVAIACVAVMVYVIYRVYILM